MKLAIFALTLLSLVRCVTFPYEPQAREVKRRPTVGGTIALNMYHRAEDRARADIMMKSNCGNQDVKIVEEGEFVVGERAEATTDRNSNAHSSSAQDLTFGNLTFGHDRPSERTTTSTFQIKQWQIAYDCVASLEPKAPVASKSKRPKKSSN